MVGYLLTVGASRNGRSRSTMEQARPDRATDMHADPAPAAP
jgi:hypothetical protein